MDEALYRIGDFRKFFRHDPKTIRKYVDLFASDFSRAATREDGGGQRGFTHRDLRVYATVVRLLNEGKSKPDIQLYLAGCREESDYDPAPGDALPEADEKAMTVIRHQEGALAEQERIYKARLEEKDAEIARLGAQHRAMAAMLVDATGELNQKIGRLEAEKAGLARQLAELQAKASTAS